MAFSSGTYTLPGPALVTGGTVSSTENNTFRNDVAASFNKTLLRDGTASASANIPMGSFKLTGLGVATNSGDALSYGQAATVSDLTTTGNTILGDASTDTLNVGNGGLVKDASGNVGIGTTSPLARLDVAASGTVFLNRIRNTGANQAALLFQSSTTGTTADDGFFVGIGQDASAYIYQQENLPLIFGTNNTERARIDSSGVMMLGQTAIGLRNSNSLFLETGTGAYLANHANGTASGTVYAYFGYNANNIGSITQNGTTGVLYNLTSDYRLKNNPEALTGAKDFVMALQPKKWQWWDGSGEGVGFVAHEFMEVAKHSGQGEKDAVDAEGKPMYQSIQPSSSEVMANLVAHIQNLETRLAALESN